MKLDPQWVDIFTWAGSGSALGTIWRALTRPEPNAMQWLIQSFISLSVGILIGSTATQYFNLTGFMAVSSGALSAYLSEEILRGLRARGIRLKKGISMSR